LACGALLALAPSLAHAETRALVVGVSGYPAFDVAMRLTGPKNDSREFANTIVRLGVPAANVTVLADGVENLADGIRAPGPGTKAAILSGLDELGRQSGPGDLVVFYFSGHGTQQPDLDGDEQGNADELFLPYDAGRWDKNGIANGLVDDELRAAVDKILARGADFFGVIDACNSATGFRAVPGDDAKARRIEPELLGVPAFDAGASRAIFAAPKAADGKRGRAAFFYAAQEGEEALEKIPPNGEEGQNFGVFTFNLVKRMNETPNLTYRTLHQAVMSDIKRNTLMATQTPEIEGDLIDEPVLKLARAPARRQWSIFNGKLQAGALDGVDAGARVALFADAAAADDQALALGVVDQAGATRSMVVSTPGPCRESQPCVADEAAFKKGRFARLLEPGIDLSVSFSEPLRLDPADGQNYAPVLAAFRQALGSAPLSARASIRATGYDIAVGLVDGKLAFASTAGAIDRDGKGSSPRLTLPEDPKAAVAAISEAVGRIGKVLALQRLGDGVDATGKLGLTTALFVERPLQAVTNGVCPAADSAYGEPQPVGDTPVFGNCAIVSVTMKNGGNRPLDVTALLVGADFSITPVWPMNGASSRILHSEAKTARILQMQADPVAITDERLIFIAVPGVGRANTVFDNLSQDGLRAVPDDPPEIAALRELVATGLNDMSRAAATAPARIEEQMAIQVRPFRVDKGG